MNENVGGIDRALRLAIGFALMMVMFFVPGEAKWWGFIGLIPFLSGAMGWDPLYQALGFSTATSTVQVVRKD